MVRKEIDSFGNIRYYNDKGQFHREDGPAIEYANGDKFWYFNGMRHRVDGPAEEYRGVHKYYSIMNELYSYEEWLAIKDFPLLW